VFEASELEELPIILDKEKRAIETRFPALRFERRGDCWGFQADFNEKSLYECPMLSEHGCMLGEEKPFDCSIYPYCVMRRGKEVVITITPECRKACARLPEQMLSVLKQGLADEIREAIRANPDLIRDDAADDPVLMVLD
jgi:hypothetical protein